MSASAPAIVRDLTLRIPTTWAGRAARVRAATDVNLELPAGQVTALIGESGCGKSVLASTLVGLLPAGTHVGGQVVIDGQEVTDLLGHPRDRRWRHIRGRIVAMVTQSAATSFTPTRRIGPQLAEVLQEVGSDFSVGELLAGVGLRPEVAHHYPHELSGGMAARVAFAAAQAGDPSVLVADEPTASLDAELAGVIHAHLRGHADGGNAVLFITHDIGSLLDSGIADRIAVMYAGQIVESGRARDILQRPEHDYTRALLAALPRNGLHPVPGDPPSLVDVGTGMRDASALPTFAARLQGMGGEQIPVGADPWV